MKMDISTVNSMSYEDFIRTFGNAVEHCGLCAAAVWRNRPFGSVNDLVQSFSDFIEALPIAGLII